MELGLEIGAAVAIVLLSMNFVMVVMHPSLELAVSFFVVSWVDFEETRELRHDERHQR